MSKRRNTRAPLWPKLVAAGVGIVALVVLLVLLGRVILASVGALRTGGAVTRDPQFSHAPEIVTRPPEEDSSTGLGREDADPSNGWVMDEEGPVDQTAAELADEE